MEWPIQKCRYPVARAKLQMVFYDFASNEIEELTIIVSLDEAFWYFENFAAIKSGQMPSSSEKHAKYQLSIEDRLVMLEAHAISFELVSSTEEDRKNAQYIKLQLLEDALGIREPKPPERGGIEDE